MCGIVGYVGSRQAAPILMDGLSRLSYRGYDSAGIGVLGSEGRLLVRKAKGRLDQLKQLLEREPVAGCAGIAHTRWATHGEPSAVNAHPHTDAQGSIAVVHNGIIENHEEIRQWLEKKGIRMISQTDTEVVAHLLKELHEGDMLMTISRAMQMLRGSYALGILHADETGRLYCARNDSPLVAGISDGEAFLASDIPALLSHTRDMVFFHDKEIGMLDKTGIHVWNMRGESRQQAFFHVDWDPGSAEKEGFAHYMLKEIHEQPQAIRRAFSPRSDLANSNWFPLSAGDAEELRKISIVACGTAYHAGMFGKYVIEKLARVPVEVHIASEYRYREPIVEKNEVVIAISQSGETADTLAALREAKRRGAHVMAVCNTVGSSIAREAGEGNTLYIYAGPEIAVASTKAYMTQTVMMILIAAVLGKMRKTIPLHRVERLWAALTALPEQAETTLKLHPQIQHIAASLTSAQHVFFIGRGLDYALSLEGALKLKEVSYVFSEAYASGELKHGPLALIEQGRVVVALLTQKETLDKAMSNLQETAARNARLVVICTENVAERVRGIECESIVVPNTDEYLTPLLAAIVCQLFAYDMAIARGCDVDQPRNLAKSVTVE